MILSFVFGVTLHVFIFRHGEWDLAIHKLLATTAAAPLALYLGLLLRTKLDLWSAVTTALSMVAASLLGMYLSMLIYRAAFHRLNRFPGPFLARLSNFYFAFFTLKSRQEFVELDKLHNRYGDVVRIGENDPMFPSLHLLTRTRGLNAIHRGSQGPTSSTSEYQVRERAVV